MEDTKKGRKRSRGLKCVYALYTDIIAGGRKVSSFIKITPQLANRSTLQYVYHTGYVIFVELFILMLLRAEESWNFFKE